MKIQAGRARDRSRRLVEKQLRESGLELETVVSLDHFVELVLSQYEMADAELNEALESLDRSELIKELNLKLASKNDE